jgi:hypothetical protein
MTEATPKSFLVLHPPLLYEAFASLDTFLLLPYLIFVVVVRTHGIILLQGIPNNDGRVLILKAWKGAVISRSKAQR